MEDSLAYAEAVAIEGDRIIFVGDKNKAMQFKDKHTRLIKGLIKWFCQDLSILMFIYFGVVLR